MNKNKDQRKIIPPELQWIVDYCNERQNDVIPQKFFDHYESVGWKIGRNKMVDWQAAVRTWERNSYGPRNDGPRNEQSQQRQKPEVAL